MPVPTITSTYPANNDSGIPVGISLEVLFSTGIDLDSAKKSIVLYGPDFDQTSGPDGAIWTNKAVINNSLFLTSPGFTGITPCDYELVYWDLVGNTAATPGVITSQTDESDEDLGHKVLIKPKTALAPNTTYHLYVLGDPTNLKKGITARTIFEVEPDAGNTNTEGSVQAYGTYTGIGTDTVVVRITSAGNINTAKYLWYYESDGIGTAVTGKVTASTYRKLDDGVQIKFSGSGFEIGDIYRFNVAPAQRLAENYSLSFTTNNGAYNLPPESPSTPASSSPPEFAAIGETTDTENLTVTRIVPADDSYNISLKTNRITIQFSEDLDPDTVTQSSVRLKRIPIISGGCDSGAESEMVKALTVVDNLLIIDF